MVVVMERIAYRVDPLPMAPEGHLGTRRQFEFERDENGLLQFAH